MDGYERLMMISTTLSRTGALAVATLVLLAPCSRADVDTDFANQLQTSGVYGPRDYNAWIGKITCERLRTHLDATAFQAAAFVRGSLAKTTSTNQTWQFLGAAIASYCPDQKPVLTAAAGSQGGTTREPS